MPVQDRAKVSSVAPETTLLAVYEKGRLATPATPPIRKQVKPQHGRQVGQRPLCLGKIIEPLEQEHGYQGCPNLDAYGVFRRAYKGFHFQILLERLEKEFYLSAFLIDSGDGRSAKVKVVGQQDDFAFILRVPNHYPPELIGTFFPRLRSGQFDNRIGEELRYRGTSRGIKTS